MSRYLMTRPQTTGEIEGGLRVRRAFLGDDDDLVLDFGAGRIDIDTAAEVDDLIAHLLDVRSHLWLGGDAS